MLDGIAAIGSGALGSAELLDRVRHQAFHDSLTGLPNRLLFEDRVNQALRGEDRHSVGVLFINLDLFKRVNDSLGHTATDGLMQQVAERLLATLRWSDSAARVGGDEFAVLLPEAADEPAALDAVWRINDAMRRPFMVEQQELVVTASVGVALSPEDGSDFAALLRSADLAMSDAKAWFSSASSGCGWRSTTSARVTRPCPGSACCPPTSSRSTSPSSARLPTVFGRPVPADELRPGRRQWAPPAEAVPGA